MESGLSGKAVLVTGASGGIGRACAEAFAEEGARLALSGNTNISQVEKLAANLGVDTVPIQADVSKERDVDRLFSEAVAHLGELDIVVANAGIWPPDPIAIHEMTLNQWEHTLRTNLTGAFLCARAFFRHLAERKPEHASLIFIGSSAAVFGEENHCDYAASKAGMTYGLTRTLKNEIVRIVPRGRVNAVCPGWTVTRMTEEALRNHAQVIPTLQTRPLKRIARAADVANAVVYLASDRLSGHVTGEILTVAGGMEGRLLHLPETIDPAQA